MDRVMEADERSARGRSLISAFAALLLTLAMLGGPIGASAEEHEDDAEDDEIVSLEVEEQSYWTNPAANAIPRTVTSRFPPGTLCLVVPEPCSEQARPITEPIDEGREEAMDAATSSPDPIQPVPPESLPTGRIGGVPRYAAAFTFALPPTPEGQEIARFELILEEQQPTYAMNSPAFRQAVLATLVGVDYGRDDQEAAVDNFVEQMSKIHEDPETYPPVDDTVLSIEACALLEDLEGETNQHWDERPEMDCFVGANGVRGDDGEWRFDLTLAAQDWDEGRLPVVGIYLGPHTAENLAFGDPDTSDNAQVTLRGAGVEEETGQGPRALVEYQEALGDIDLDDGGAEPRPAESTADDPGSVTSAEGDVFGQSPQMSTASEGASEPATAEAPEVAAPASQEESSPTTVRAVQETTATPGSAWALLALALAGLIGVARMLAVEPAVAGERAGAMTRLIEGRHTQATAGAADTTNSPEV